MPPTKMGAPPQGPQTRRPTVLSESHLAPLASSPSVWGHGDPPAFDLAQLRVRDLYLQGESGGPHGDLQLRGEVLVGEVHDRVHFALHLLPIHEDGVAVGGYLWGGVGGPEMQQQEKCRQKPTGTVHEPQGLGLGRCRAAGA